MPSNSFGVEIINIQQNALPITNTIVMLQFISTICSQIE